MWILFWWKEGVERRCKEAEMVLYAWWMRRGRYVRTCVLRDLIGYCYRVYSIIPQRFCSVLSIAASWIYIHISLL